MLDGEDETDPSDSEQICCQSDPEKTGPKDEHADGEWANGGSMMRSNKNAGQWRSLVDTEQSAV